MKFFCVIFVFLFLSGGCAAQQQNDPTTRVLGGAALGAATGAALGAATGKNPGKGAAIGGLVGGILGALTSQPPSYQSDGYDARYDGDVESQCDSFYHEDERQACKQGVQSAESDNANHIRNTCWQVGQNHGEAGVAVPVEAAGRYTKEIYRNACLDGLREGHASGWQQRLHRIENNAARRSRY